VLQPRREASSKSHGKLIGSSFRTLECIDQLANQDPVAPDTSAPSIDVMRSIFLPVVSRLGLNDNNEHQPTGLHRLIYTPQTKIFCNPEKVQAVTDTYTNTTSKQAKNCAYILPFPA
jgi:hypothetical protein